MIIKYNLQLNIIHQKISIYLSVSKLDTTSQNITVNRSELLD